MSNKVKIPGLEHFDRGGAAFGVFPQLSGRRSVQDPEAAKNAPLDLLRGALSGLLGTPGDIEQLGRSLLNWSFGPGGVNVSPKTVIPTSSDVEKMLPLRPETQTPVGSAATTLGQLVGGLAAGPVAGKLPNQMVDLGFALKGGVPVSQAGGPAVWIGEKSPLFDRMALLKAERMERAGYSAEEIKAMTNMERGLDNVWRQQESLGDLQMRTSQEIKNMYGGDPLGEGVPMSQVFANDAVTPLYPDAFGNMNVALNYNPLGGSYYKAPGSIAPDFPGKININMIKSPESNLAHELQHGVQTSENWPSGANELFAYESPSYAKVLEEVRANPENFMPLKAPDYQKAGYDWYQRQPGEAEARAAARASEMAPESRRSTLMADLYDIPREKILYEPDQIKAIVNNELIPLGAQGAISGSAAAGQIAPDVTLPTGDFGGGKEFSFSDLLMPFPRDGSGGGSSIFDYFNDMSSPVPFQAEAPMEWYAEGGQVQMPGNSPSLAQMKMALSKFNPQSIKSMGVNEAIDLDPKLYVAPDQQRSGFPPPGGVATPSGMPIGGIDMSKMQPGQQLMPQPVPPSGPQGGPAGPQGGPQGPQGPMGGPMGGPGPQGPQGGPMGPQSNILQMTPQGQAMNAMTPSPMPNMAKGGEVKSTRVQINAEGPGKVKGIVVPRHMLEGNAKSGVEGMNELNKARAQVYGAEHREPLSLKKIGDMHKKTLEEHFAKPVDEQMKAEAEALGRLRASKHIGKTANTLDESEKLDTVRHETDEEGRTHVGYAAKGVAGHALYTSGHGKQAKHHILNTCPGQTTGCGGGIDEKGIVDTKRGTCFAPNAEAQYPAAAVRRAAHAQAKHDPAMTNDWILAHTGSLRHAANLADKKNQRTLFRPNVVDETDVSSRHVLRHLNEQRKSEGKPPIIANSYGKTNELHDPENGYYVTHSNVGPKVKHGHEITENIGRDKARVRNTILAADNKGDFKNEQGNKTPPKGSYMVTDVKRGSPMAKEMEKHITHAKYWSTGREQNELSPEEKAEGPEGHFGGNGKATTPEKAHYGHTTLNGRRYDYQKQHILHPRLVQVGKNKDGTPHMIPTDSRFKDTEFLPKNRFKTKNGKEAGHILMTTPTESTSNLGHHTPFTHNVNQKHIEHAKANRGEYEIDAPHEQEKARGKEYVMPQPINIVKKAGGGSVGAGGRDHDDFYAFPEQNLHAQYQLSRRYGDDEELHYKPKKKSVTVHKRPDTMRLELMR